MNSFEDSHTPISTQRADSFHVIPFEELSKNPSEAFKKISLSDTSDPVFIFLEVPFSSFPFSYLRNLVNDLNRKNLIFILFDIPVTQKMKEALEKVPDMNFYSFSNFLMAKSIYSLEAPTNLLFRIEKENLTETLSKEIKELKEFKEVKEKIEISFSEEVMKSSEITYSVFFNENIISTLDNISAFVSAAKENKNFESFKLKLIFPFYHEKEWKKAKGYFENSERVISFNKEYLVYRVLECSKESEKENRDKKYVQLIENLLKLERAIESEKPEISILKHIGIVKDVLKDFIKGSDSFKCIKKELKSHSFKIYEENFRIDEYEKDVEESSRHFCANGYRLDNNGKPMLVNNDFLRRNSCENPLDKRKCSILQKTCEIFKVTKKGEVMPDICGDEYYKEIVVKEAVVEKDDGKEGGGVIFWVWVYIILSGTALGYLVLTVKKQQSRIDVMKKNYSGIFSSDRKLL